MYMTVNTCMFVHILHVYQVCFISRLGIACTDVLSSILFSKFWENSFFFFKFGKLSYLDSDLVVVDLYKLKIVL